MIIQHAAGSEPELDGCVGFEVKYRAGQVIPDRSPTNAQRVGGVPLNRRRVVHRAISKSLVVAVDHMDDASRSEQRFAAARHGATLPLELAMDCEHTGPIQSAPRRQVESASIRDAAGTAEFEAGACANSDSDETKVA